MHKKWIALQVLCLLMAAAKVVAAANAPIQRIDIANILWNFGGISQTAVHVAFDNGTTFPCYTATLAFQEVMTVWAGTGQNCVAAISSVTITPLPGPGTIGTMYDAPPPFYINTNFYSTQLIISQETAPVFDPTNGAPVNNGTVQVTVVNNLSSALSRKSHL